jgi:hypothetical protein
MSFSGIYSADSEWLVTPSGRMQISLGIGITTQPLDCPVFCSPVCPYASERDVAEDEDGSRFLDVSCSTRRGVTHTTNFPST